MTTTELTLQQRLERGLLPVSGDTARQWQQSMLTTKIPCGICGSQESTFGGSCDADGMRVFTDDVEQPTQHSIVCLNCSNELKQLPEKIRTMGAGRWLTLMGVELSAEIVAQRAEALVDWRKARKAAIKAQRAEAAGAEVVELPSEPELSREEKREQFLADLQRRDFYGWGDLTVDSVVECGCCGGNRQRAGGQKGIKAMGVYVHEEEGRIQTAALVCLLCGAEARDLGVSVWRLTRFLKRVEASRQAVARRDRDAEEFMLALNPGNGFVNSAEDEVECDCGCGQSGEMRHFRLVLIKEGPSAGQWAVVHNSHSRALTFGHKIRSGASLGGAQQRGGRGKAQQRGSQEDSRSTMGDVLSPAQKRALLNQTG